RFGPDTVRWTRMDQLHLTLKFFGNVQREEVDALQEALRRAVANVSPFALTISELGCFPSPQRPNVIWLGLGGGVSILEQMQRQVALECAAFGSHSEDRAFHAHLTIGRAKALGRDARRDRKSTRLNSSH